MQLQLQLQKGVHRGAGAAHSQTLASLSALTPRRCPSGSCTATLPQPTWSLGLAGKRSQAALPLRRTENLHAGTSAAATIPVGTNLLPTLPLELQLTYHCTLARLLQHRLPIACATEGEGDLEAADLSLDEADQQRSIDCPLLLLLPRGLGWAALASAASCPGYSACAMQLPLRRLQLC